MKNKKSGMPVLTGLVRLILGLGLLFIFANIGCTVIKNFSNKDDKVAASFEGFVNMINAMSDPTKSYTELDFKKGSAIVGFRKGASTWECYNCHTTHSLPTRVFIKPSNDQCKSTACMCLCPEGFVLEGGTNKLAKCGKPLMCKILNKDIKEVTIIRSSDNSFSNDDTYWKNGFLFVDAVEEGAGSGIISLSPATMFVDNNEGVASVCTQNMRENNLKMFGNDKCTTPP